MLTSGGCGSRWPVRCSELATDLRRVLLAAVHAEDLVQIRAAPGLAALMRLRSARGS